MTDETTHTPGPLTYEQHDDGGFDIYADENGNGERVARVWTEADARLMRTAPDLLTIVREVLHVAEASPDAQTLSGCIADGIPVYRAAIEKATAQKPHGAPECHYCAQWTAPLVIVDAIGGYRCEEPCKEFDRSGDSR